jgi:hypothetical protein
LPDARVICHRIPIKIKLRCDGGGKKLIASIKLIVAHKYSSSYDYPIDHATPLFLNEAERIGEKPEIKQFRGEPGNIMLSTMGST